MSKKAIFIGIITFLILFITTASYADQYYDQYPGNSFQPENASLTYYKFQDNYFKHSDTTDGQYFCPVNFSVPDGSTYFIKSIAMQYFDNLTDGYVFVALTRKNLYTGNSHNVAFWYSGTSQASENVQRASKGTESGVKLIDTKKFVYSLRVQFFRDGDVNPNPGLGLYQVRIHYGT